MNGREQSVQKDRLGEVGMEPGFERALFLIIVSVPGDGDGLDRVQLADLPQ